MEIFHGGLPVILPSSVLQQILQADRWGGNLNTQPPPACALLLLCSEGHLRVMDELKSLSIRQDRLKGSGNANSHIFPPRSENKLCELR